MLFEIALDPECFGDRSSTPVERDALRTAVEWFGVLSYSQDELGLIRERMSQGEWHRWAEVIKRVPRRPRPHRIPTNPADGVPTDSRKDALLVLGDALSPAWLAACGCGIGDGVGRVPATLTEVVNARHLSRSSVLQVHNDWTRSDLLPPADGSVLWNRLAPLFEASTRVTIVDPYALKDVSDASLNGHAQQGILWLLDRVGKLSSSRPDLDLTVIARQPDPLWCEAERFRAVAQNMLGRGGSLLRSVTLAGVPDSLMSGIEHGRHLRFSSRSSRMVTLDHSLDQIGEQPFKVRVGFTYRLLGSDVLYFQNQEEKLLRLASEAGTLVEVSAS